MMTKCTDNGIFSVFFFFLKSCRAHVRGFSADSKRDIPRNFFFFLFFLINKPLIRGSAMEGTEEEKNSARSIRCTCVRACMSQNDV